jgi:2-polyprenyl-3-methyl-5-hydroxy-6-metoxy-1,4-benzoquinol methylase
MTDIYKDGTYLSHNPSWHAEDSVWKAQQIKKMLAKNSLAPRRICEIGCGAGEILHQLSLSSGEGTDFYGYEISPQAHELCRKRARDHLTFRLGDLLEEEAENFDLVLAIDVFEHVEDCFGFLRKLKGKARNHIFHIPLDLSVQSVLRATPILNERKKDGHVHHFTKETALDTLRGAGYEIIDHFYTCGAVELPNRGWQANLIKLPRKLAYALNRDLAVRILGGCSLLVLTR